MEKELLLEMYKKMFTIRRFEEKVAALWAKGMIAGLAHLYIGEEAVAVGACLNLRKDDYIISTHRGHGHCLAKGGDPKKMMAELLGKATGYCKGKGGSMHICVPEIGIVGCTGIAGAGIPIACGVGVSIQLRRTDQVCICFFGDGAANTGAFHEGMNLAAVWRLPIVFICENNLYAISVPTTKSYAIKDISIRAQSYGMVGVSVDGMDVVAVYQEVEKAVKRARAGDGPTLIECKTYRFRGHHEGDPKLGTTYRSESEISEWVEKCPIKRLKKKLVESNIFTDEEIKRIEEEIDIKIEEAANYAIESPYPPESAVYEDLFVEGS